MSKYALAKELLESGYEKGKELSLDEADVAEVMVVQSIQELIRVKGAKYVKEFLKYEADSVSEKKVLRNSASLAQSSFLLLLYSIPSGITRYIFPVVLSASIVHRPPTP